MLLNWAACAGAGPKAAATETATADRMRLFVFMCSLRGVARLSSHSLVHPPYQVRLMKQVSGDLLDRLGRGVEVVDSRLPHELLGLGHLVAAVLERGVFRVGPALGADLREALGSDGKAPHLLLELQ